MTHEQQDKRPGWLGSKLVSQLAAVVLVAATVALGMAGKSGQSAAPDAGDTTTATAPAMNAVLEREHSDVTTPTTQPHPKPPEIENFELVFDEHFDIDAPSGSFLERYPNWFAYPTTYRDTSKKGYYDPANISVADGTMSIRVRSQHGTPTGAAPQPEINQLDRFNQLYGRYEVRFRAEKVHGYKIAWLLWPKSEVWPRDGEIDFPEGDLDGQISAFMHWQGGTSGGSQDKFVGAPNDEAWHTAVIEWEPHSVTFILDGREIGKSTSRIPNTPMRWVLQTETTLTGVTPTNTSGSVHVDYARVWKYTGPR